MPRYSETKWTEKEMGIISAVFQYMTGPLHVDWDAAAIALGYANGKNLRSYWGHIRRTKLEAAGPGGGSGVRKRKWGSVDEGGEGAVEGEVKPKKKRVKKVAAGDEDWRGSAGVVGAGPDHTAGGDGETWFDAATGTMDGMDRRIKVEEGAAPALAPAPASVMAGSDGHGAVAGKSDKTKAKNIVTPTSAAPTSPANGYAAAIPRVKKRKIDEDAAWTPAHVTSWVVGGDTDTANVKEKKSSVGATSNPVAARARNAEDADDIAIVKERKLDIRTVAAPVAPMARSAAPAPDAAKDNRLVIPGGTMMPRKQKREHGDADKLAKKKKTLSLKDKIADLRPEDPSWTDYMVRKPKEAHPGRSDGSKVAATGQKKKADGQRKGGSQAVADGRKTVDGGRQDCGRPADAAKKTVKQEPEPVISIETGSGGFGAGFASSFESSHNAGAATVMAPMYNDGYYGNVGFDGQTDGSFSASTNPDDGGFFQAALEGFVAGHGYPLDQFDGQQPGFSNEQMGLAHPCNDFNGQQGLSNEHAGQNYPLNHFNPGYPSNDYIGVGYPQHGGHPQYTGYPDWSQPAYGPAGYGYGAAGYGFGLIG